MLCEPVCDIAIDASGTLHEILPETYNKINIELNDIWLQSYTRKRKLIIGNLAYL